jgi:hypothetical protein
MTIGSGPTKPKAQIHLQSRVQAMGEHNPAQRDQRAQTVLSKIGVPSSLRHDWSLSRSKPSMLNHHFVSLLGCTVHLSTTRPTSAGPCYRRSRPGLPGGLRLYPQAALPQRREHQSRCRSRTRSNGATQGSGPRASAWSCRACRKTRASISA